MKENYLFRIGPLMFMLHIDYSKIGYAYPQILISWPDDSYSLIDLTLCALLDCSKENWYSCFEDFNILEDEQSIQETFASIGLNWKALENVIFEMYEKALDNDD